MKREEWREIKGYEGLYEVSNFGNIKSLSRSIDSLHRTTHFRKGILIKKAKGQRGYLQVALSNNGTRFNYLVHRLVALAFIPNPDNKPQVNHRNGIKTDNMVDNLEWSTSSENLIHAFSSGLRSLSGSKHPMSRLVEDDVLSIIEDLNKGVCFKELAVKFSVSSSCISDIRLGKRWSHLTGIKYDPKTRVRK